MSLVERLEFPGFLCLLPAKLRTTDDLVVPLFFQGDDLVADACFRRGQLRDGRAKRRGVVHVRRKSKTLKIGAELVPGVLLTAQEFLFAGDQEGQLLQAVPTGLLDLVFQTPDFFTPLLEVLGLLLLGLGQTEQLLFLSLAGWLE